MAQSLSAGYIHLVFSTKHRRPLLKNPDHMRQVHAYLGGISKQLGCAPIMVGGTTDHVHLLGRLNRTTSLAAWVKEIKRVSSLWIKSLGSQYRDFEWQGGYAGFSVSHSGLNSVVQYISNQEAHHQRTTFEDELRLLLSKHGVDFDERYIWH
ncbi:MAG: transposase [Acidobacteria bacterium]|nr:transposase [Acidobacteriota bacterium]